MRVMLDVPIPQDQIQTAMHARNHDAWIQLKTKHGVVEKAKIVNGPEYRLAPQGIGNGYFIDVMIEGSDDVSEVGYVLQKLADASACSTPSTKKPE
jgi:hypothetical protein